MKGPTRIAIIVLIVVCATSLGDMRPRIVGGQAVVVPGQTPSSEVDVTPAEQSAEVQRLLQGSRFVPDSGEPAGAIKDHIATEDRVRKAWRRIELGVPSGASVDTQIRP